MLYYVVLSVQPFPCICRPAPGPGLISFSFRHLLSPRSPHGWAGPGVPRTARAAALLRTNVLRSCCGIKDAPSQRPVLFLSPPTAHRPTDNSRGCSPSPHAHLHARRGIPTQQNGDPRGALTAAPAAPDGGGRGGPEPAPLRGPEPAVPGLPAAACAILRPRRGRERGREGSSIPPPSSSSSSSPRPGGGFNHPLCADRSGRQLPYPAALPAPSDVTALR